MDVLARLQPSGRLRTPSSRISTLPTPRTAARLGATAALLLLAALLSWSLGGGHGTFRQAAQAAQAATEAQVATEAPAERQAPLDREAAGPRWRRPAPGWALVLGTLAAAGPADLGPAGSASPDERWRAALHNVTTWATAGSALGLALAVLALARLLAAPLLPERRRATADRLLARLGGSLLVAAGLAVATVPLLAAALGDPESPSDGILGLLAGATLPVLGLTLLAVERLTRPRQGEAERLSARRGGDGAGVAGSASSSPGSSPQAARFAAHGGTWPARPGEVAAGLLVATAVFLRPDALLAVAVVAAAAWWTWRRVPVVFLLAALLPLVPWLAWLAAADGPSLGHALLPAPPEVRDEAADPAVHAAARYLREIAPPGVAVATPAGDLLGYLLARPILDLGGDGDPRVAAARRAGSLDALVTARQPRYLLLAPGDPLTGALLGAPAVGDHYRPIADFTAPAAGGAAPRGPSPHLTLYERHPLRFDVGLDPPAPPATP